MATTRAHPVTGANSKMTYAGANIHLKSWSRTGGTTLNDTTDSGAPTDSASGLPRKQQTPSMVESTFHLVGEIRAADNPVADPPNLNDGETVTTVRIYAGAIGYWNIYEGIVHNAKMDAAAGGLIPFECDIFANNDIFVET